MIRVSQRLDYALRAVIHLASQRRDGLASGTQVAVALGLPQRVVEQQLSALTRAGILVSRPGAGGGHALARPASGITLGDVIDAIEGRGADVPKTAGQASAEMWADIASRADALFDSVTIDRLVERQTALDAANADEYVI